MKWTALAFLATWISGLAIPFIKILLSEISPFYVILFSNFAAAFVLMAVKPLMSPHYKRPKKKEWPWLIGGLILGPALAVPLVVYGMSYISGTVSGLILNLETFFTFALAYLLFREPLSGWAWGAMIFVLLGGIVSAWGGPFAGGWKGIPLLITACLLFGFQANFIQNIESQDGFSLAIYDFLVAGVVSLIMVIALKPPLPTWTQAFWCALTGILTFAFANVLYFHCVKKLGAGRTATIFGATPLMGAISSLIILGDPLTLVIVTGSFLVMTGVGLLFFEEHSSID